MNAYRSYFYEKCFGIKCISYCIGIIFIEISLLAEADYVLCIDAIGQGTNLNLHVSKPPKEGSPSYFLVQVKLK